jgi:diguanylate cyclase (GGDEF)-like protein
LPQTSSTRGIGADTKDALLKPPPAINLGRIAERRRSIDTAQAPVPTPTSITARQTRQWMTKLLPFVATALLGEASGFLPPGPRNLPDYLISVGLLALCAAVIVLARRGSRATYRMSAILLYLASWTFLGLAEGGPGNGLLVVALLPVLWAASFESGWTSVVTGFAMSMAVGVEVIVDSSPLAIDVRRWVFATALALLVTFTIRNLREHMLAARADRDELLREGAVLAAAEHELLGLRHPEEMIAVACRVAAGIASPLGGLPRWATYLRIDNGLVSIVDGYDAAGETKPSTWRILDHPYIATVLHRGEPMAGPLDAELLGETLRDFARDTGVTHGAWIPVAPNGKIDGILSVVGRGAPVSPHLLGVLAQLGRILEPALANARINELVEEESLTDPLTLLLNRRGLMRAVTTLTGGRSFAVLSADLDGLKLVNDTQGHAAGDALICTVASALSASARALDVCARVGGDEFVVLLRDGDDAAAQMVAGRVFAKLHQASPGQCGPELSVGIASGGPLDTYEAISRLADLAMYVAKRKGGNRAELRPRVDAASA